MSEVEGAPGAVLDAAGVLDGLADPPVLGADVEGVEGAGVVEGDDAPPDFDGDDGVVEGVAPPPPLPVGLLEEEPEPPPVEGAGVAAPFPVFFPVFAGADVVGAGVAGADVVGAGVWNANTFAPIASPAAKAEQVMNLF